MKKYIISGLVLLLIGTSITPNTIAVKYSFVNEVYVDNDFNETTDGWGFTHFNNIQDGINEVSEGGTVHVYEGFYKENVEINKQIILKGENNRTNIIIDGSRFQNTVTVYSSEVEISGFTIQNSSYEAVGENKFYAGIRINSDDNFIHHNDIINCGTGILLDSSINNIIEKNFIYDNILDGIGLYSSSNNVLKSNTIIENLEVGIYLQKSASSNLIKLNNISGCSIGILLWALCNNNVIMCNIINWTFLDSQFPRRTGNGIVLEDGCFGNDINKNDLENNSQHGIFLWKHCNFNMFHQNDFVDNKDGTVTFEGCFMNDFQENYYDDWGQKIPVYTIWGRIGLLPIPNFDWYPREARYDYPCP